MEESDVGIESDLLRASVDIASEQAVQEGQNGVDRVSRRPLRAQAEGRYSGLRV